ncbi:MAG: hypothetical protein JKX85_14550 [Phycisphaeraceae bacterium]|nr:hypothetical protein [Phycisphaeraceae bacterium]
MTRTLGHIAFTLCVLIVLISSPCAVSAAIVNSADEHYTRHHLIQSSFSTAPQTHKPHANSFSIITRSNTLDPSTPNFVQQVTHELSPSSLELTLPRLSQNTKKNDGAIQLISERQLIRSNGSNSMPMDSRWTACCGDGTVLAAIDSSFHTLVKTTQRQTRRSASLVAIAKAGTALPLSFEVSRRTRGKSIPEPTSLTLISIAGLLLLRRPKHRHTRL